MTSLWLDRASPVADDPLPGSGDALDALVVGAGLTGLTTSLLLARAGLRVACVEARRVGAVTTGRTTGKVSLLQGTHLSRIRSHQSEEVAAAYVDANREGMEWLLRFCDDHAVPYQRRTAVTYAADEQERSSVEKEHRAAAALGLAVEWRDTLDVPFPHVAATTLADQAQLDAMDVLAALAEQLRAHGGTLHQGHRVRSVSKGGRPTVRLEGGETLTADHLVLATGTPILDRGLHFARLEPQRSYVLALDGAGPMEGMYLSAGSDARSVRDAPGGTLVVGGAGHVVGRTDSHLAHLERLRGWAAKWYPATTETHHWSAQDYSSPDGVPYVGPLRWGGDRIHVATGYEKWGMTNAVVAARAISSDILGDLPSWAQTLSGRTPSASNAAEIARINLGVGTAVVTGAVRTARERLPGNAGPAQANQCGIVGVCTHLGGLLKWNDAEETWDCPLHGSRFSPDGEVLEGPATRPLLKRPSARRGGWRQGRVMSGIRRVLLLVVVALLLAGCGSLVPTDFPADPDGTLDRVRDGGVLRVGASPRPGWVEVGDGPPSGREAGLATGFADHLSAEVEWTVAGEEELVRLLEEGKIDLAVGGFTDTNAWVDKVGLTRAYTEVEVAGTTEAHVMMVPMGENALQSELERWLDTQPAGGGGGS